MTRKFKIKLLIFAVILILINTALDQAFKAFSVHNILNRKMDEQFAAYDDTLKYLAFGNSHDCINTHILNDCFNYGSPSENYIQSYYKLKYILEKSGKKPEYFLLQSDASSYGKKISDRYEYNSYWIKYIDYIELAKVKDDRSVLWKWLEGMFFSYAGNYKDIQLSIVYRIKMKNLEMYRGFRPHRNFQNFASDINRQKSAWNKASLINSSDGYFDPSIRYYFIKMLELCQQYNVKLVLIRYPVSKEFDDEERKIVPVDKLYTEVDSIAAKYSCYAGTLDYHNIYFDNPNYFFDPDHLNVQGSDLLTERLAEDLQAIESQWLAGLSIDR
ncbi:MAG: hypothetical protein ACM3ME_09285 [Chloroflexota bacterium]|nr:hypothetical protein [Lentimicrobium sp.]